MPRAGENSYGIPPDQFKLLSKAEKSLLRCRRCRANNPEKVKDQRKRHEAHRSGDVRREYHRAWREKNREQVNAREKQWRHDNIEYVRSRRRAAYARRKAMKKALHYDPRVGQTHKQQLLQMKVYEAAQKAVPRGLPEFMRDDVVADIVLAFLEGKLTLPEVKVKAREFVAAHNRMFDQWKTLSLDAKVPGSEGKTTYLDLLVSEEVDGA